jgi:hypothetical protein
MKYLDGIRRSMILRDTYQRTEQAPCISAKTNRRKDFKRESKIPQNIGKYLKVIFETGNIGISI